MRQVSRTTLFAAIGPSLLRLPGLLICPQILAGRFAELCSVPRSVAISPLLARCTHLWV